MSVSNRILVVDDNADFRFLICHWLKSAGFDVQTAKDAFEAFAVLEADPTFDLTLSDFDMPLATGIDLHARLRTRGLHQPFVLTTANVTIKKLALEQAGIDGFLLKPFTSSDLIRCVRGHLQEISVPQLTSTGQES